MASGPKLARGSIKFSRKARRIQRRLRVTCTVWTTKNIEGSFCFRKRAGSCSRSGSAAGGAQWMSGSSNRKFVRQSSSILFRLHGTGKRLSRFFYTSTTKRGGLPPRWRAKRPRAERNGDEGLSVSVKRGGTSTELSRG